MLFNLSDLVLEAASQKRAIIEKVLQDHNVSLADLDRRVSSEISGRDEFMYIDGKLVLTMLEPTPEYEYENEVQTVKLKMNYTLHY